MLYFLHRHSEWHLLKLCFYANLGFFNVYIYRAVFARVGMPISNCVCLLIRLRVLSVWPGV